MFDEFKEESTLKNHRIKESYNIKNFKEIKRLQFLLVKAEVHSKPKQASIMEPFCEYS